MLQDRRGWRLAAVAAVLLAATSAAAEAEAEKPAPEVTWTPGPAAVDVGGALAKLELPEGYAFAGEKDSQALLRYMGNLVDGSEVGIVIPRAQEENWLVVLEWDAMGYVKDDDKDALDPEAILKSIREATEEGNEERKEMGSSALHVLGWSEPPHYDAATHNLTWALLGEDEAGGRFVNHNVRVLGRTGVMSITLIDDPERIAASKPQVEKLVAAFSYKPGKTYAEWVSGDKVAEYGLTALVAAGAGAAAVKLGFFAMLAKLFAKSGKLILAGVVALGAGATKFWNALRGKASARPARPPADPGATG
jgi:uncharacterized membrane-anchored protein